MSRLNIAIAQYDFTVGAITANLASSIEAIDQARAQGAHVLVLPELAITGYPPEDLLHRPGFIRAADEAFLKLKAACTGIDVIACHPCETAGYLFNAASWIREGEILGTYHKHCLPNYAVFDERRYFQGGEEALVIEIEGVQAGVLICEDAWESEPAKHALAAGAEILLVPNASPYRQDKLAARSAMLQARHAECGLPIVYLNCVGGQDELVFDGRSMLLDRNGAITATGPHCSEHLLHCTFDSDDGSLQSRDWPEYSPDHLADTWTSLVRGTADYITKNGFTDVVIGLSGGIDSAITVALAVDAVGSERVHTVMMPSRHTSELSLDLAIEQAQMLGIDHQSITIEPAYEALLNVLEPAFAGTCADVTEENLQARCRANILLALSNKFGWLVLTTGNKSELAVGYCTIYGDMAGGFAPIKDCYKTLVTELARFRNSRSPAIPEAVIERPPSAELAPDQLDADSLPAYDLLDEILHRYIDLDYSIGDIVADGFEEDTVRVIAGKVLLNEYKRRQAAPGIRISNKAFGRDRRYPITSHWKDSIR